MVYFGFFYQLSSLIKDMTCGPNQFSCGDGECIPETRRCNKQQDCKNLQDEIDCRKFTFVIKFYRVVNQLTNSCCLA